MVSKVVNDGAINWNKLCVYISGGVRGVTSDEEKILWRSSYCGDYNVFKRGEVINRNLQWRLKIFE